MFFSPQQDLFRDEQEPSTFKQTSPNFQTSDISIKILDKEPSKHLRTVSEGEKRVIELKPRAKRGSKKGQRKRSKGGGESSDDSIQTDDEGACNVND